jgi:cyclophilin family peptidyl-prolyl cis-trans isomerase
MFLLFYSLSTRRYLPVVTDKVFMNVQIGDDEEPGRIELGLFGGICPKAVKNFIALCQCDDDINKGRIGKVTGKPLCYKNSSFHRVVTDFGIQGGDFSHSDGTGGESIFDSRFFEDESMAVQFNRPYLLSMANSGTRDTNGSQFFINTGVTMWLDNKNVVFGYVLHGEKVIDSIMKQGTYGGKPKVPVTIVDSGVLPVKDSDLRLIPVGTKSSMQL